mgnify:CR=1 FL=1
MSKTTRRQFLSNVAATGAAGALGGCTTPAPTEVAAVTTPPPAPAPAPEPVVKVEAPARRVLGPNDRIRCAFIGVGGRGGSILDSTLDLKDVDVVAVSDVYKPTLERAVAKCRAKVPDAKAYVAFEELLAAETLDAVVIGAPDHIHAPAILAALDRNHDVYTEKPMTLTWQEAKAVRDRVNEKAAVLQTGTQLRSVNIYQKAREVIQAGGIGKVVMVQVDRHGWGGFTRSRPANFQAADVDWQRFLRDTKPYPFEEQRYLNWRRYVEYSNGASGDLMLHHLDLCHFITGCGMPQRVMSTGGIYQLNDGRTCADTIGVLLEYPEKFTFSFAATFVNGHYGLLERYLGSEGTIEIRDMSTLNIFKGRRQNESVETIKSTGINNTPHLEDFFRCMRTREKPIAPIEAGFMGAICCHMAVLSEQSGDAATWDATTESVRV